MELYGKIKKLLDDANDLLDAIRESNRDVTDIEIHLLETEIHILQLEISKLKYARALQQGRKE